MISITELRRGLGKFIALTKRVAELPIPSNFHGDLTIYLSSKVDLIATMKKIGGKWEKCPNDYSFQLTQKLSEGMNIKLIVPRSAVCDQKIVGSKLIPEYNVPAHTEDVIEWTCQPLLDEGREVEL